jgi:UDP-N-acetylmuramoyl-tripeptide--D-alanyl-D-alanine ligase
MHQLFELFYHCTGISTDTRALEKECLFVCLKGDRFDANEFAEQAIQSGAKYVISSDRTKCDGLSIHYVENTLIFLQQLAHQHRKRHKIPVLGITGSNGKTTTKELINAVLCTGKKVLCTKGNLNNHIGVPLTLLQLRPEHEIAIIEMGANRPGDIAELCDIAEPTHGIITNIGRAHLEGFGSFEGVLATKLALYRSVSDQEGTLFVNADDETLTSHLPKLTLGTFSIVNESEVVGVLEELNPYVTFTYKTQRGTFGPIQTHLVGAYNLYNFLTAVAVGLHFGVSDANIATALGTYIPSNNRSQVQKTDRNTLIVDCYNANPSSMTAALASFERINTNKKLAILGDMLELGEVSHEEHMAIIEHCKKAGINCLTIGKEFGQCHGTNHFENVQRLLESGYLASIHETTVLVKGSRGIGLEQLIPYL